MPLFSPYVKTLLYCCAKTATKSGLKNQKQDLFLTETNAYKLSCKC